MQTKRSNYTEKAKGTTKQEFQDVMKLLVQQARDRMAEFHLEPRFSWDNASTQATADLEAMGLTEAEKVPLAPYMPDAHQVIEHAFANLKRDLWNNIYEHGAPKKAAAAQERVAEVFLGQSHVSIFTNVHGKLIRCYQVVSCAKGVTFEGLDGKVLEGSGGDWARAADR